MRRSHSENRSAQLRVIGGWCLGIALLGALMGSPLQGQETVSGSHECCLELLYPVRASARMTALAGAVVADTSPDMVLSNPAGIAGLHKAALQVHSQRLPADVQVLGLSFVTRPYRFGTFAISYTLNDAGSLPSEDTQGNETGTFFTQAHAVEATFATSLGQGVTGGVTMKIFARVSPGTDTVQTGGGSGLTQLVDFGLQYHPRWNRWLAAGFAVSNAGLPLQIVNYRQSDPPPMRVRVGGRYEVLHLFQKDTTVTGALLGQVELRNPEGPAPAVGAEVTVGDVVSVRTGWRGGGSTLLGGMGTGVSLGVGLKVQRYSVSVAKSLTPTPLQSAAEFDLTFGMSF